MSATTSDPHQLTVSVAEPAQLSTQHSALSTRHSTVLVAEPDPALASRLTGVLADAGYSVAWAPNGEYALHTLAATMPDAVLLDLDLPLVSAHRLLEVLRHSPETQRLPVAVLTDLDFQEARDVIAEHPDDLIAKPAPPTVVVQHLERLLGRHGARRASSSPARSPA